MKTCLTNVVISEENLDRLNEKIYLRQARTAEIFNQTKVLDRPLHCPDTSGVTLTFWLSFNISERTKKNCTIRSFDVLGAKPTTKPTNNLIKTLVGTNEVALASMEPMQNAAPG